MRTSAVLLAVVSASLLAAAAWIMLRSHRDTRRSSDDSNTCIGGGGPTNYDSYVLATEWTGTVCRMNKCDPTRPNESNWFNLHGLWPNVWNDPTKSPQACSTIPLNYNNLPASTQDDINLHWNGLYSPTITFIDHEWSKHGTCWIPSFNTSSDISKVPLSLQPLVSQAIADYASGTITSNDFILVALSLSNMYNFRSILSKHNIVPDNTKAYTMVQIQQAIQAELQVSLLNIYCSKNPTDGRIMLGEIRICLDLQYNPINCMKNTVGGCSSSVYFLPDTN